MKGRTKQPCDLHLQSCNQKHCPVLYSWWDGKSGRDRQFWIRTRRHRFPIVRWWQSEPMSNTALMDLRWFVQVANQPAWPGWKGKRTLGPAAATNLRSCLTYHQTLSPCPTCVAKRPSGPDRCVHWPRLRQENVQPTDYRTTIQKAHPNCHQGQGGFHDGEVVVHEDQVSVAAGWSL